MSSNYFDRINGTSHSDTGTGLDQIVDTLSTDLGLAGRISQQDLHGGLAAANAMNAIIVKAMQAKDMADKKVFSVDDVRDLNAYIRANHFDEWVALHGDDEGGAETGYHLVQNDGASERYRGDNLANTVADGLYHLGFAIQGDRLLNEDGDANATLQQVAEWLTQFYTDHSNTGTGLDRMTDMVMADKGLSRRISDEEIAAGAEASNGMAGIIAEAIAKTETATDGKLTSDDIRELNAYIRANHEEDWVRLHGDDENGEETGFHLVQNDGASTRMFGENFVNTVLDGINHLGFEIQGDTLLNEDGNANADIGDVADWLNYFYVDQSDTGTGLDRLVDAIKSDRGLSCRTDAGDINEGAAAANQMNHLLMQAIESQGLARDGVLDVDDVRKINEYLRDNHLDEWMELHGDDEGGKETGFHLVQNDGGNTRFRGDRLIDTVADGLYHLGFKIAGDNVLNEDGNRNANLGDLATWLNQFYLGKENIFGSDAADRLKGLNSDDFFAGRGGDDRIHAGDGNDVIFGDAGNDKLAGQGGNDRIHGGTGNDRLYGGDGQDDLQGDQGNDYIHGNQGDDILDGGEGDDRLSGGDGSDFLSGGLGNDRLSGSSGDDFLKGEEGSDRLSGGDGDDQLYGGQDNDYLSGGDGHDGLSGGEGDDRLSGNDGDDHLTGGDGNDRLSGGDGADALVGGEGNDRLSGGDGSDLLSAGNGNDRLSGGDGDDRMDAGDGNDKLCGGSGADQMSGGKGNDYLVGHSDDDIINGGEGHDKLVGGSGADRLDGGAGADRLYAGSGDDLLITGADGMSDYLRGDSGADTYQFMVDGHIGNDVIKGFSKSQGDQLVIGGDEVSFQLDYLGRCHTLVTLTSADDRVLGSIDVWGDRIGADDISLNGISATAQVEIA